MARWGLWGIALMYLLEGMALPWPIEVPLWLSGEMLQKGEASYWQLVLATWSGASLGNLIAFAIGRWGGRPLLMGLASRFHLETKVAQAEAWINRYGLGAVIFTRWINWGFGICLWLIGFSKIPPAKVLAAMIINTALWACAWVGLGRLLVGSLSRAGLPSWLLLLPALVLLVALGGWRLWRRWRPGKGAA